MKKSSRNPYWLFSFTAPQILIISCCSIAFGLLFISGVDKAIGRNCYDELAEHYETSPNYSEIREALNQDLRTSLKAGMTRNEVFSELENISSTRIIQGKRQAVSRTYELVELEICPKFICSYNL